MGNTGWFKEEKVRFLILALPFIFLVIFWTDLPARFSLPWHLPGQSATYNSRIILLSFAATNVVLCGLFLQWPHLNSNKLNAALFKSKWHLLQIIIHLFLSYLFFIVALVALGYQLQTSIVIKYGLICLFLILGSYIGTIPYKSIIGIRLPWTLNSEYIWSRTHRFAALLWVNTSLLMFIYSSWQDKYRWLFGLYLSILVLAPVIYAYVIFRNQSKILPPTK